jgi:hypothetical protein
MSPKKQTLWVSPHPKNNFTSSNPLKKPLLERVGITHPILPSSPKKNPFEKKKKIPNPLSPFLKFHLQLIVIFN